MRFLRSRSLSFPSNITGCTDASSTDHLVWHRSIERFYRSWSLQAAFAGVDAPLGLSTLRTLHEAAPPSIRRRIADRTKDGLVRRRWENASRQHQCRLNRKAVFVGQP